MRAGYLGGLAAWFTLPSAIALVLFAYGASALVGFVLLTIGRCDAANLGDGTGEADKPRMESAEKSFEPSRRVPLGIDGDEDRRHPLAARVQHIDRGADRLSVERAGVRTVGIPEID